LTDELTGSHKESLYASSTLPDSGRNASNISPARTACAVTKVRYSEESVTACWPVTLHLSCKPKYSGRGHSCYLRLGIVDGCCSTTSRVSDGDLQGRHCTSDDVVFVLFKKTDFATFAAIDLSQSSAMFNLARSKVNRTTEPDYPRPQTY